MMMEIPMAKMTKVAMNISRSTSLLLVLIVLQLEKHATCGVCNESHTSLIISESLI